ncbi:titin-like isoform X6 [Hordeum vulgare subsp. vulgare]|uniref:titin-like isoform X6 n=1 Tax=Hordeum vulgare subsp. vulgare TaxID=112509 RepID=UPI001D1A56A5|nr:titin-like isoform X6 [Hordeum vulgare subsp. vulgare]
MAGLGTGAPIVKVYHEKSMILPDVSRVLACLYEKDIAFERETFSSYKSLLRLQASSHVPVPFYDGPNKFLEESREICHHIAETYEDHGYPFLLGKDSLERASIEEWLHHEEHNFNPPSRSLFCHLAFPVDEEDDDIDLQTRKLEDVLEVYEQRLGDSEFLAGNKFTLADLVHLPNSYHITNSEKFLYLYDSRKNVQRWWHEISSRGSWQKVLKVMHEVEQQNKQEELDKQQQHKQEELEKQQRRQWRRQHPPTSRPQFRLDSWEQPSTKPHTIFVRPPANIIATSPTAPQAEEPHPTETSPDETPVSSSLSIPTTHKPSDVRSKHTTISTTHEETPPASVQSTPRIPEKSATPRIPEKSAIPVERRINFFTPATSPTKPSRTGGDKPRIGDASLTSEATEVDLPTKSKPSSSRKAPNNLHVFDYYEASRHTDEAEPYTGSTSPKPSEMLDEISETDRPSNAIDHAETSPRSAKEDPDLLSASGLWTDNTAPNADTQDKKSVRYTELTPQRPVGSISSRATDQRVTYTSPGKPRPSEAHQKLQSEQWHAATAGFSNRKGEADDLMPPTQQAKASKDVSSQDSEQASTRPLAQEPASMDGQLAQGPERPPYARKQAEEARRFPADRTEDASLPKRARDDTQAIPLYDDDTNQEAKETASAPRRTRAQDPYDTSEGTSSRSQHVNAPHDAVPPPKRATSEGPYGRKDVVEARRFPADRRKDDPPPKRVQDDTKAIPLYDDDDTNQEARETASAPRRTRAQDPYDTSEGTSSRSQHVNAPHDAVPPSKRATSEGPYARKDVVEARRFPADRRKDDPPPKRVRDDTKAIPLHDDDDTNQEARETASAPRRTRAQDPYDTFEGTSSRSQPVNAPHDAVPPPKRATSEDLYAQKDVMEARKFPADRRKDAPVPKRVRDDTQAIPLYDDDDGTKQEARETASAPRRTRAQDSYDTSEGKSSRWQSVNAPHDAVSPPKQATSEGPYAQKDVVEARKFPADRRKDAPLPKHVQDETEAIPLYDDDDDGSNQEARETAFAPRQTRAQDPYDTPEGTSSRSQPVNAPHDAVPPPKRATSEGPYAQKDVVEARKFPADRRKDAPLPRRVRDDIQAIPLYDDDDTNQEAKQAKHAHQKLQSEQWHAATTGLSNLKGETDDLMPPTQQANPSKDVQHISSQDAEQANPRPLAQEPVGMDGQLVQGPERTAQTPHTDQRTDVSSRLWQQVVDVQGIAEDRTSSDHEGAVSPPYARKDAVEARIVPADRRKDASFPKHAPDARDVFRESKVADSTPLQKRYPDAKDAAKKSKVTFEETKNYDSPSSQGQPLDSQRADAPSWKKEATEDPRAASLVKKRHSNVEDTPKQSRDNDFKPRQIVGQDVQGTYKETRTWQAATTPTEGGPSVTPPSKRRSPSDEDTIKQPGGTAPAPRRTTSHDANVTFQDSKPADSMSSREQPLRSRQEVEDSLKGDIVDDRKGAPPLLGQEPSSQVQRATELSQEAGPDGELSTIDQWRRTSVPLQGGDVLGGSIIDQKPTPMSEQSIPSARGANEMVKKEQRMVPPARTGAQTPDVQRAPSSFSGADMAERDGEPVQMQAPTQHTRPTSVPARREIPDARDTSDQEFTNKSDAQRWNALKAKHDLAMTSEDVRDDSPSPHDATVDNKTALPASEAQGSDTWPGSTATPVNAQPTSDDARVGRFLRDQGAQPPESTQAQTHFDAPHDSVSTPDVPRDTLDKTKSAKPTSTEGMTPTAAAPTSKAQLAKQKLAPSDKKLARAVPESSKEDTSFSAPEKSQTIFRQEARPSAAIKKQVPSSDAHHDTRKIQHATLANFPPDDSPIPDQDSIQSAQQSSSSETSKEETTVAAGGPTLPTTIGKETQGSRRPTKAERRPSVYQEDRLVAEDSHEQPQTLPTVGKADGSTPKRQQDPEEKSSTPAPPRARVRESRPTEEPFKGDIVDDRKGAPPPLGQEPSSQVQRATELSQEAGPDGELSTIDQWRRTSVPLQGDDVLGGSTIDQKPTPMSAQSIPSARGANEMVKKEQRMVPPARTGAQTPNIQHAPSSFSGDDMAERDGEPVQMQAPSQHARPTSVPARRAIPDARDTSDQEFTNKSDAQRWNALKAKHDLAMTSEDVRDDSPSPHDATVDNKTALPASGAQGSDTWPGSTASPVNAQPTRDDARVGRFSRDQGAQPPESTQAQTHFDAPHDSVSTPDVPRDTLDKIKSAKPTSTEGMTPTAAAPTSKAQLAKQKFAPSDKKLARAAPESSEEDTSFSAPEKPQTIFRQEARPSAAITKQVPSSDAHHDTRKIQHVTLANSPPDDSPIPDQDSIQSAKQPSPAETNKEETIVAAAEPTLPIIVGKETQGMRGAPTLDYEPSEEKRADIPEQKFSHSDQDSVRPTQSRSSAEPMDRELSYPSSVKPLSSATPDQTKDSQPTIGQQAPASEYPSSGTHHTSGKFQEVAPVDHHIVESIPGEGQVYRTGPDFELSEGPVPDPRSAIGEKATRPPSSQAQSSDSKPDPTQNSADEPSTRSLPNQVAKEHAETQATLPLVRPHDTESTQDVTSDTLGKAKSLKPSSIGQEATGSALTPDTHLGSAPGEVARPDEDSANPGQKSSSSERQKEQSTVAAPNQAKASQATSEVVTSVDQSMAPSELLPLESTVAEAEESKVSRPVIAQQDIRHEPDISETVLDEDHNKEAVSREEQDQHASEPREGPPPDVRGAFVDKKTAPSSSQAQHPDAKRGLLPSSVDLENKTTPPSSQAQSSDVKDQDSARSTQSSSSAEAMDKELNSPLSAQDIARSAQRPFFVQPTKENGIVAASDQTNEARPISDQRGITPTPDKQRIPDLGGGVDKKMSPQSSQAQNSDIRPDSAPIGGDVHRTSGDEPATRDSQAQPPAGTQNVPANFMEKTKSSRPPSTDQEPMVSPAPAPDAPQDQDSNRSSLFSPSVVSRKDVANADQTNVSQAGLREPPSSNAKLPSEEIQESSPDAYLTKSEKPLPMKDPVWPPREASFDLSRGGKPTMINGDQASTISDVSPSASEEVGQSENSAVKGPLPAELVPSFPQENLEKPSPEEKWNQQQQTDQSSSRSSKDNNIEASGTRNPSTSIIPRDIEPSPLKERMQAVEGSRNQQQSDQAVFQSTQDNKTQTKETEARDTASDQPEVIRPDSAPTSGDAPRTSGDGPATSSLPRPPFTDQELVTPLISPTPAPDAPQDEDSTQSPKLPPVVSKRVIANTDQTDVSPTGLRETASSVATPPSAKIQEFSPDASLTKSAKPLLPMTGTYPVQPPHEASVDLSSDGKPTMIKGDQANTISNVNLSASQAVGQSENSAVKGPPSDGSVSSSPQKSLERTSPEEKPKQQRQSSTRPSKDDSIEASETTSPNILTTSGDIQPSPLNQPSPMKENIQAAEGFRNQQQADQDVLQPRQDNRKRIEETEAQDTSTDYPEDTNGASQRAALEQEKGENVGRVQRQSNDTNNSYEPTKDAPSIIQADNESESSSRTPEEPKQQLQREGKTQGGETKAPASETGQPEESPSKKGITSQSQSETSDKLEDQTSSATRNRGTNPGKLDGASDDTKSADTDDNNPSS